MSDSGQGRRRRIGRDGPEVLAIGLGCMSLSGTYGPAEDEAGIELIHRALDLGVDHFDSSDMYGWGQNEELLGRAFRGNGATVSSSRPSSARRRTPAAPTASTAAPNMSGRPATRA